MDDASIQSLEDLQRLLTAGETDWKQYGDVNARIYKDLVIFNYTQMAQYAARWNYFEQISRGLILNARTGEIVARPFDKFFNWLEGGRKSDGSIVSVTEKVDGSLGVLYRVPDESPYYRISTRGSFDGPQAIWATRFLNENHDLSGLSDDLTLLFEIVYPDNRIVVNYGQREDLVLLAARNRHTAAYLPFYPDVQSLAQRYGFSTPKTYHFADLQQIFAQTQQIDAMEEGYVVEFSDGQRFKFKGERYMDLQKLLMGLTFKNVLNAMSTNTVQDIIGSVPEEYLGEVRRWIDQIEATIESIRTQVKAVFEQAPKDSRKDFAMWVNTNHKDLSTYLFQMLSGYDIVPMIYKLTDWSAFAETDDSQAE